LINYYFYFSQRYETELKEMENQNLLITNQNKSMNDNLNEIITKNQTLEDEIAILKASL